MLHNRSILKLIKINIYIYILLFYYFFLNTTTAILGGAPFWGFVENIILVTITASFSLPQLVKFHGIPDKRSDLLS